MKNKKLIVTFCLVGSVVLFANFTAHYKTAGSHPGSTGAPGDNTCAKSGCHSTASLTFNDTIVNQLVFPNADSTYLPGQTYTITVNVQNSGINKFGFELVALKDADDLITGQFSITDVPRTQIISHTANGELRYSVTHKTAGTSVSTPGLTQWTFDWTAPSTNVGTITFYYATNCTDNNGTFTGDAIFLSSYKIKPFSGTSIVEYLNAASTKAYYDNSTGKIVIDYYLKADKAVAIKVHDNLGREVYKDNGSIKLKGQQTEQIDIENNLSKGVYFVNLQVGNKTISKKIIIQ